MKFSRSHDGNSFVIYVALDNAPEHVRAYQKIVLPLNRADELHRALTQYLAEQQRDDPWIAQS